MFDISVKRPDAATRLSGKVALVTGGGRGIGAAIAAELASQGAAVAIGYRNSRETAEKLAEELTEAGFQAMTYMLDTSSSGQIRQMISLVTDRWGGLDILVNNAGMSHPARIEQLTDEIIDEMLAVNVKGVLVAIREALPHIRAGGRILNVGSIASEFMPYAGNSLYVTTKSAVSGITRGLARELAERNITINNVQPGPVETDMLRKALGKRFEDMRTRTPLGRFGYPSEVANMVAFLASDEAAYVTGAHIRVDGGASV